MRLFGYDLTLSRTQTKSAALATIDPRGGWWGSIRESFTGAWQRNITVDVVSTDTALAFSAVFRCISLISSDIAKCRIKLVEWDASAGIWREKPQNTAHNPVLRKPNRFQNRIRFIEDWVNSLLIHGNAFILKERDARGVVCALYVLSPNRVKTLVAPDGSVYYRLQSDNLSGITDDDTVVPASEMIHDRRGCLWHPLVGTSPIVACGLAATQGIRIQQNSVLFFQNGSNPGGVLTAPGAISKDTAERMKLHWEQEYGGGNGVGKVAVLGDGLKYEAMAMSATDAQLIEQLKYSAETVCSVFGVPPYKVGVGQMPTFNNISALNVEYYSNCIQAYVESIELCLDEGLDMPSGLGTEFDLDNLLRLDTASQFKMLADGVKGSLLKPNEARQRLGYGPVAGGDAVYAQHQDYSLAALAKRDARPDPFASAPATPQAPEPDQPEPEGDE